MKVTTIFGVDEVIKALNAGHILYEKNGTLKYWMYQGIICSSDMEDDEATVRINVSIMANQEFEIYG